jgi:hypothetical protein
MARNLASLSRSKSTVAVAQQIHRRLPPGSGAAKLRHQRVDFVDRGFL